MRASVEIWQRAGWALLAVFVVVVAAEHLLVPQLAPASHMVSEYANARAGAVMVIGFFCWAASLGITALVAQRYLSVAHRGGAGRLVVWLLALAATGICVTACFSTQTSAGVLPPGTEWTTSGRLHDAGSGVATLALFGAAIASTGAFDDPPAFRRWVLIALAIAVGLDLVLLALGPEVGGLRQRVLIAIACTWQAAVLARCGKSLGRLGAVADGATTDTGRG
jgi:Protein of unknown function (DUF998)